MWAAWSPESGGTYILTDESAAILELLQERGSLDSQSAAIALAEDVGSDASSLLAMVDLVWLPLEWSGLIRRKNTLQP